LSGGSCLVYVSHMFGVKRLRSIKAFNCNDYGFGALVLRARAQRLSGCHKQRHAGLGIGAESKARSRVIVIVGRSKDVDIIFCYVWGNISFL
jgi:hypothetical protein